jgi:phage terminase large subunit-like protein
MPDEPSPENDVEPLRDLIADLTRTEKLRLADGTDGTASEILAADWRGPGGARKEQLPPPGDWRVWLLLAGRGFGKTRSGAEWVREQVKEGRAGRVALVAPTAADARDVMIEGESGILAVTPERARPLYEPSKRRVTWPNGAVATAYSAEEPDRLRGPQHDAAWCDELAVWRHDSAWDMLMFGLRLGADPRCVVTTTPKPGRLLLGLLKDPTVAVTRGTTFDNRENLARAFFDAILKRYRGTRLGRQELLAEMLEDMPGALWSRDAIERASVPVAPALARVVVAIDPAASAGPESDETGIVVAALGEDGHGYVLDDLSGRYAPHEWARRAVAAYKSHAAERIVAEAICGMGGIIVTLALKLGTH